MVTLDVGLGVIYESLWDKDLHQFVPLKYQFIAFGDNPPPYSDMIHHTSIIIISPYYHYAYRDIGCYGDTGVLCVKFLVFSYESLWGKALWFMIIDACGLRAR